MPVPRLFDADPAAARAAPSGGAAAAVLVTGASGTIGRRLCLALAERGHRVTAVTRRPPDGWTHPRLRIVQAEVDGWTAAQWQTLLQDSPVVVNTIGIFGEHAGQTFERLHEQLPRALFGAALQARVPLAIQLSALGADEHARSAFHRSKRAADEWLLAQPLPAVVVQPSLVFAPDGASSRLLLALASLPLLPLPDGGGQGIQPLHVDDAVAALCALVESPAAWRGRRIAFVGPAPLTLRGYLLALRRSLGLGAARIVAVPGAVVAAAARVTSHLNGSLLTADSWAMLRRGNCADAGDIGRLLGRAPRPAADFLRGGAAGALRLQAQWRWLGPLLRAALAFVWLFAAWTSLLAHPLADSLALLARSAVPAALRMPALVGAALLDLLLGVLTLALPQRRRPALWLVQIALVLGYSAVIVWRLPEFWLHPFGPVAKNAVIVAVLVLLYVFERRGPH